VKDLQKGLAISFLVHSLILGVVYATWIYKPAKFKTISLDFSIVNYETNRDNRKGILNGDRQTGHESVEKKEEKKLEHVNSIRDDRKAKTFGVASGFQPLSPPPPVEATGNLSDKEGSVEVHEEEGSVARLEASGIGKAALASAGQTPRGGQYGNNEGQTIRYGSGGINEKTFYYIREGILKNVRYPENARRKGLEGKILLSFVVMENGTTHDVKVINGSGFRDLDNSAQDAIKKTTFTQKIPYKLFVTLPIEFRLE